MRYLSLFSGVGGGDLGLQHLVGMECVGYVEWNKYCCRVLEQRRKDGLLSNAPIFNIDIRKWIESGYAASYTGLVDLVAGGFPCQPFSVAGKRAGADDERNMWPATIGIIRIIRPRYCFLENVPGLLTSGYFPQILQDLAESGYDARWRVLSAAEVGAPHKRDRLWIVAYANGGDEYRRCSAVQVGRAGVTKEAERVNFKPRIKWGAESGVGRTVHGVASRVERLNAAGNGQVPLVAATAWRLLSEGLTSANPLLSPKDS